MQSPGSPYVPLVAQEECVSLQTQVKQTCSAQRADAEPGPKVPTALNDIAHENPSTWLSSWPDLTGVLPSPALKARSLTLARQKLLRRVVLSLKIFSK